MLALDKLAVERGPSKVQTILGWEINTRTLSISLPTTKYKAWLSDLDSIIDKGSCMYPVLDKLLGHLVHASIVIPMSRYFLEPFRWLLKPRNRFRRVYIPKCAIPTLALWRKFLHLASLGIDLNMLSDRVPTNIVLSDSYTGGIGGFSMATGTAWRMDLSEYELSDNNPLEYLAAILGILIEQKSGAIPACGSILALTNNSSALC
jgi:hypothetical protein